MVVLAQRWAKSAYIWATASPDEVIRFWTCYIPTSPHHWSLTISSDTASFQESSSTVSVVLATSCYCNKFHYQRQLEEKMVSFILPFPVCQEGKSGQELKAWIQRKTINTTYWRLTLHSLFSFLSYATHINHQSKLACRPTQWRLFLQWDSFFPGDSPMSRWHRSN